MRFAAEAGFLILVGVGAALVELRPLAIIILLACALLLVGLIERATSREERPARSHVGRPDPETSPVGAPAAGRRLDVPRLEEPAPVQEPIAAPSRPRFLQRPGRAAAPHVPQVPPPPPPAREWNIWDLERLAREQAGDAPRDEEWAALFTHLRPFASADGVLPKEFDDLVRESFGQLIEAA